MTRYLIWSELVYAGCYRASCVPEFLAVWPKCSACFNSRFHEETYTAATS